MTARWHSVCGIHRTRRPVKRCEICRARLAELRAEPLPPLRTVLSGELVKGGQRENARRMALNAAVARKPKASSNPNPRFR